MSVQLKNQASSNWFSISSSRDILNVIGLGCSLRSPREFQTCANEYIGNLRNSSIRKCGKRKSLAFRRLCSIRLCSFLIQMLAKDSLQQLLYTACINCSLRNLIKLGNGRILSCWKRGSVWASQGCRGCVITHTDLRVENDRAN